jgi:hypothetical protein
VRGNYPPFSPPSTYTFTQSQRQRCRRWTGPQSTQGRRGHHMSCKLLLVYVHCGVWCKQRTQMKRCTSSHLTPTLPLCCRLGKSRKTWHEHVGSTNSTLGSAGNDAPTTFNLLFLSATAQATYVYSTARPVIDIGDFRRTNPNS